MTVVHLIKSCGAGAVLAPFLYESQHLLLSCGGILVGLLFKLIGSPRLCCTGQVGVRAFLWVNKVHPLSEKPAMEQHLTIAVIVSNVAQAPHQPFFNRPIARNG